MPEFNKGPELPPPIYDSSLEQNRSDRPPSTSFERDAEQFEQRSGAAPPSFGSPSILPPPVITPIPPVTTTDSSVAAVPDEDNPIVANDDDLIEKEWVDKAKQIIAHTKDDPYRREQEVSKLQADYLQKRYGREIGASQ